MSRLDTASLEFQSLLAVACCDDAAVEDLAKLEGVVCDEPALELVIDFFQLDGELHRLVHQQSGAEKCFEMLGLGTASPGQMVEPATLQEPPSPMLTSLGSVLHNTLGYFSQEIPFSLLIATVITGLGLWIGSLITLSHDVEIVRESVPPVVEPSQFGKMEYVGHITGMVNCKWADPNTATMNGVKVRLGRKFALASGLMEITYDTGAKVILQGPVTYEVESASGGFLSVGKLTASVGKKVVSSQLSVVSKSNIQHPTSNISNPQPLIPNPSSLSTIHDPLFTIKTPTATVTDLGTEFGVEVTGERTTETHVFQGAVQVVLLRDGKASGQPRRIIAGQIALVTPEQANHHRSGEIIIVTRPADPKGFPRKMPMPPRPLAPVDCNWEGGANGTFQVAEDDLINMGQSTLGTIRLTSGKDRFGGAMSNLNNADIYGGDPPSYGIAAFCPNDGSVVTVALNTAHHPRGYDINSVVSLTGCDITVQRRSAQKYDLACSLVGDPDAFIAVSACHDATVNCGRETSWPEVQVKLFRKGAPIASGVAKLRFTFHNTTDSWDPESIYREIDVFGAPTPPPEQNLVPALEKKSGDAATDKVQQSSSQTEKKGDATHDRH